MVKSNKNRCLGTLVGIVLAVSPLQALAQDSLTERELDVAMSNFLGLRAYATGDENCGYMLGGDHCNENMGVFGDYFATGLPASEIIPYLETFSANGIDTRDPVNSYGILGVLESGQPVTQVASDLDKLAQSSESGTLDAGDLLDLARSYRTQ